MPATNCMLWSGGKDSFLAYSMASSTMMTATSDWLFVTLVPPASPFRCHPLGLLERQSAGLGIEHLFVSIDLDDWRRSYSRTLACLRDGWGVSRVFTGDILFDGDAVERYWLTEMLQSLGMELTLPLAGMHVGPLLERMEEFALEAVITGVAGWLDRPDLVGSILSLEWLHATGLYRNPYVDLAGEGGEYHTTVLAAGDRRFAAAREVAAPATEVDGIHVATIAPALSDMAGARLDPAALEARATRSR